MKLLGRTAVSAALLTLPAVLLGCGGGGMDATLPGRSCAMNSECQQGLMCSFGRCQSACKEQRDCPTGQQCVMNGAGVNSCLLPAAEMCHYNSECQLPLVCAADLKCRNQCLADRDCATASQKCVQPDGVCAEPDAISTSGALRNAATKADAAAPQVANAPDAAPLPADVPPMSADVPPTPADGPATQGDVPVVILLPDAAALPTDAVPTGATTVLDIVPRDNMVGGWTVDPANPVTAGRVAATARTLSEAEGLIDGASAGFFAAPYTPIVFAWQNYVSMAVTDAPAPSGANLSLYILQMPSVAQASGLYASMLTGPLYSGRTWMAPSSPRVGTDSRIADTGDHWWINFYKGNYYVEISLSPSYGPAPDYTPSDPATKAAAFVFATAIAARIPTGGTVTPEGTGGTAVTGGTTGSGGVGGSAGAGGAGGAGGSADPYVWLAVQDTELVACTTSGPGADIDAVALWGNTSALGWGKIGSAVYTANALGNSCENADCAGGNCKYAAISTTYPASTLVGYTEGPRDAVASAVSNDSGYFSLNGGTLQIQIGDLTGAGPAREIKPGDKLKIFEFDQTYITSGDAPASCSCLPEHYRVTLQTATGAILPLTPTILEADNTACSALTASSTEGCGTTVFVVPGSASAQGATVVATPSSVNVGQVDVGKTSAPVTVVVTNVGKAAASLTILPAGSGIAVTGCAGTLAAGGSCTLVITASPTVAGAISGSVSVAAASANTITIAVSGTASIPGSFVLTPQAIDLGTLVVGQTIQASVTVTATSALTGLSASLTGADLRLDATSTCTSTLAAGASCSVVFNFSSAVAGSSTGDAVVVSQGGVTRVVPVTAMVVTPAKLALTPTTAAFAAALGGTSSPIDINVANIGGMASGPLGVVLGGANAADFKITSNKCGAVMLASSSYCSVTVVYAPAVSASTTATATLTVTDTGVGASTASAALTGTAYAL